MTAPEMGDEPRVIRVDLQDRPLGTAGKLEAHREGMLHRAVSVFAFDDDGLLLLQRRAEGKYHSGGLWSNSACTHPREAETVEEAARRCMREELGVECHTLQPAFRLVYRASVSPALQEYEYDHVFTARVTGTPVPAPGEVSAVRRVSLPDAAREVQGARDSFTVWFPLLLHRLLEEGAGEALAGG